MKSSLNLISDAARQRVQLRRSWRLWSRVMIVVLLLLSGRTFLQWKNYDQQQQRLAAVEAQYEPIRMQMLESQRLKKRIASFQASEQVALALSKEEPLLNLVGLVSQAVISTDGKVHLQELLIDREPLGDTSITQPQLTCNLTGITIDNSAATRLEDSLRKTGPFESVKINASQGTRLGKMTQQSFTIRCTN